MREGESTATQPWWKIERGNESEWGGVERVGAEVIKRGKRGGRGLMGN